MPPCSNTAELLHSHRYFISIMAIWSTHTFKSKYSTHAWFIIKAKTTTTISRLLIHTRIFIFLYIVTINMNIIPTNDLPYKLSTLQIIKDAYKYKCLIKRAPGQQRLTLHNPQLYIQWQTFTRYKYLIIPSVMQHDASS